jgi:hypothetical protein
VALDVPTYRRRLEDMTAETMEEFYRQSAGLKPTLEIAPIYERYHDLSTLEQLQALGESRAPSELRRFACEALIGNGCKQLTEQAANTQAALTIDFDGVPVAYRSVRPRLMNEADPSRRRDLYARRCAATDEHLNPILAEATLRERQLTRECGADSVLELYEGFGFDPMRLREHTRRFLADTDELYRSRMDEALHARLGIGLDDATPADTARLWRAPEFDVSFPRERSLPALRQTLAGLGIDLDRQANVELDIEERPNKHPRAFCAPIRVPGRVVLVTLPQGGQDDYRALFHEAGHTEHYAHTEADLPAEARVLGDNAVTEGFAFLLEHLIGDRHWLGTRLDLTDADDYLRFGALAKLYLVRRYAAKLEYEVALHSGTPLEQLPGRYTDALDEALGIRHSPTDYLEDVDGGFYCTRYLRAWAFEAQLTDHLRSRFGNRWFAEPAAGGLLRELWRLGQSLPAGELCEQVTGRGIEFGVLAAEAKAALPRGRAPL